MPWAASRPDLWDASLIRSRASGHDFFRFCCEAAVDCRLGVNRELFVAMLRVPGPGGAGGPQRLTGAVEKSSQRLHFAEKLR